MTKIIPSLGKLGHQEVLDVFLEIVEAIPSNSILRDQSGVLKPHYSNAKSLFDAGKLWNDVARLAHIATSKLTIFGGGEVVEIKAIKEEILETLRSEMRTSTDHEATLRTFSLDADRRFEAVFGGRFGFKDHDDIYHFNLRNEITAKYLHHLKPDWLDEEVLKQLGLIIVLAIHLADQTLRDRVKSNSAGEAVPV